MAHLRAEAAALCAVVATGSLVLSHCTRSAALLVGVGTVVNGLVACLWALMRERAREHFRDGESELASFQALIKAGLFSAFLVNGLLAGSPGMPRVFFGAAALSVVGGALVTFLPPSGPKAACRARMQWAMVMVGWALTVTGDVTQQALLALNVGSDTAWTLTRLAMPSVFLVPTSVYTWIVGRVQRGSPARRAPRSDVGSRATQAVRQLHLALASSLGLLVVAAVFADELADACKRGFTTPKEGPVYFRLRALSMALGFCGEYIGSRAGLDARRAAGIQVASQLLRTGAALAGCQWWTQLLVISIEDVTGGAMAGAVNVVQEKEARRSPTAASILDTAEHVSKAIAPALSLVSVRWFGLPAVVVAGATLQGAIAASGFPRTE